MRSPCTEYIAKWNRKKCFAHCSALKKYEQVVNFSIRRGRSSCMSMNKDIAHQQNLGKIDPFLPDSYY